MISQLYLHLCKGGSVQNSSCLIKRGNAEVSAVVVSSPAFAVGHTFFGVTSISNAHVFSIIVA